MATTTTPLSIRNPIMRLFRSLGRDMADAYRPEQHYMRGPGPKWREKHAPQRPQVEGADLRSAKPAV